MKRLLTALALISTALGTLSVMYSCEKENSDYDLTILVTINDTIKVQNATVRVFAPVKPTFIDFYNSTDEKGEVSYSFDNKVVVEIVANKGSYKACGFAEVDQGSNNVRIDLKPYGTEENGCQTN